MAKARSRFTATVHDGGAETTINIDDSFAPIQLDQPFCYRIRQKTAYALTGANLRP